MQIAVLGVGGVGGCIAALLTHGGAQVTCVGTEATVEAIRTSGLTLESPVLGRVTTRPVASSRLDSHPDILFVATKAVNLDAALQRVPQAMLDRAVVIPLLNGLDHMSRIRSALGGKVVAGSIRIEATKLAPGHISHKSPFILVKIASDGDVPRASLDRIAAFLTEHGIETHVAPNETTVLWDKLTRLVALACATAMTDRPIGEIRADPELRGMLESAVTEAVAVAQAEGVQVTVADQMRILDGMPASLTTSLQRDVAAGKASELDAIAGAVVRAGARHGIKCPTIERMIKMIEVKSMGRM